MTGNPISVFMAPGEADRQEGMEKAIKGDKRFCQVKVKSGLPVDLQFILEIDEEKP